MLLRLLRRSKPDPAVSEKCYLVVGLGNIGAEYAATRHNIGFMILDAWAQASNVVFEPGRYGDMTVVRDKGREFHLLKPSTYMNLSGNAVRYWQQKLDLPLDHILIICDDINLPFGAIRLRASGSPGGHNGLENIEQLLGTPAYPRLRIGIGNEYAEGQLVEMPIYTEMRPFWDFVSVIRMFRMIRAKFHKHKHAAADKVGNERVKELTQAASRDDNRRLSIKSFFRLSPLKMDFNQVSARGQRRMMRNVIRRSADKEHVDVVLIGHSKTFVPYNEKTLEPFLKWVSKLD